MRARLLGHQLHPMLVAIPIGMLVVAPLFDVVHLIERSEVWAHISFWMITVGLVGGVVAAIPGLVDLLGVPRRTRARRVGLTHLALNLGAIVVYGVSWALRLVEGPPRAGFLPFVLAVVGLALLVTGSWFGAELVERLGFGVHPGAHLDAPSSLDEARLARRPPAGRPTEPRPA